MAKSMVDLLAEVNGETDEKEPGMFEFSFPLLTVRTQMFGGVFERLGSFRFSRWLSWIALVVVPVVAAIGLYLLCSSLFTLLWTPVARDATRELGLASYILLPGINPILPIVYGWLAIVCAIAVHEGAHGIIARNRGLNVKSSGLLFFLIIPIGAFVDVDEEQIAKSKPKDSLRVMAAGVAGNVVVAVACLLALLVIVNGLAPVVNGIYIYGVAEGMPADYAGLLPGDVFISVDGVIIDDYPSLNESISTKGPGDTVHVEVIRGETWEERFSTNVMLTEVDNKTVMGISLFDPREPLTYYRTLTPESIYLYMVPPSLYPGLVPFSDSLIPFYTHPLGTEWHVFANIFFWLWFVNVNVAVFNALPIYPLDGGRMFDISLKSGLAKKIGEKNVSRITYTVTATLIGVLVLIAAVPFLF